MRLIRTYEEGEYTVNEYENGTKEMFLTGNPPKILKPPVLTEDQELMYETHANTEMLLALKELEGGLT